MAVTPLEDARNRLQKVMRQRDEHANRIAIAEKEVRDMALEVQRLRAALKPFAECDPGDGTEVDYLCSAPGAVAAARHAYQQSPTDPDEGLPTADDVRGILK